jgi:hypothetical protein
MCVNNVIILDMCEQCEIHKNDLIYYSIPHIIPWQVKSSQIHNEPISCCEVAYSYYLEPDKKDSVISVGPFWLTRYGNYLFVLYLTQLLSGVEVL